MCKVSLLFHTLSSWETYGLRCVSFRYEESISSSSLTLKFIQTYSSLVKSHLAHVCFYAFTYNSTVCLLAPCYFLVSIVLVGYFQVHAVKRKCLKATNTQSFQNVKRLWNNWSSCDFGWIQYLFYYLAAVFRTWAPITDWCIITWGRDLERGREGGNPINVCDAWQCHSVLSFVSSVLFLC